MYRVLVVCLVIVLYEVRDCAFNGILNALCAPLGLLCRVCTYEPSVDVAKEPAVSLSGIHNPLKELCASLKPGLGFIFCCGAA